MRQHMLGAAKLFAVFALVLIFGAARCNAMGCPDNSANLVLAPLVNQTQLMPALWRYNNTGDAMTWILQTPFEQLGDPLGDIPRPNYLLISGSNGTSMLQYQPVLLYSSDSATLSYRIRVTNKTINGYMRIVDITNNAILLHQDYYGIEPFKWHTEHFDTNLDMHPSSANITSPRYLSLQFYMSALGQNISKVASSIYVTDIRLCAYNHTCGANQLAGKETSGTFYFTGERDSWATLGNVNATKSSTDMKATFFLNGSSYGVPGILTQTFSTGPQFEYMVSGYFNITNVSMPSFSTQSATLTSTTAATTYYTHTVGGLTVSAFSTLYSMMSDNSSSTATLNSSHATTSALSFTTPAYSSSYNSSMYNNTSGAMYNTSYSGSQSNGYGYGSPFQQRSQFGAYINQAFYPINATDTTVQLTNGPTGMRWMPFSFRFNATSNVAAIAFVAPSIDGKVVALQGLVVNRTQCATGQPAYPPPPAPTFTMM